MGFIKNNASSNALARDIVVVLAVKLLALIGIWYFFVHDHKVPHTPATVTQHLFEER